MTSKIDGLSPPAARAVEAAQAGTVARAGSDRSQSIGASPPVDSVRFSGEAAGLSHAIEQHVGQPAGMDIGKINSIRAALNDGSYRINPQEIATRLVALERQMMG